MTAIHRKDVDSVLATTLAEFWNDGRKSVDKQPKKSGGNRYQSLETRSDKTVATVDSKDHFRFKRVQLDLPAEIGNIEKLASWADLLRSDHSRFWYHNVDYPTSFPAVLITDTGISCQLMEKAIDIQKISQFLTMIYI